MKPKYKLQFIINYYLSIMLYRVTKKSRSGSHVLASNILKENYIKTVCKTKCVLYSSTW